MHLGFACGEVFIENVNRYDIFSYIEDDTAILDPDFFHKVLVFYVLFGSRHMLLPHRYEMFSRLAMKTFLDQPAPPSFRTKPDFMSDLRLEMPSYGGTVYFDWTDSASSGCYVITREQLAAWAQQPDFLKPVEGSPMDALEQAGTPLGGRFPVYKPALSNMSFLEVHHVPNKASNAVTPRQKLLRLMLAPLPSAGNPA